MFFTLPQKTFHKVYPRCPWGKVASLAAVSVTFLPFQSLWSSVYLLGLLSL